MCIYDLLFQAPKDVIQLTSRCDEIGAAPRLVIRFFTQEQAHCPNIAGWLKAAFHFAINSRIAAISTSIPVFKVGSRSGAKYGECGPGSG